MACWSKYMGPAEHITFEVDGEPRDRQIGVRALTTRPDVIFYTGGEKGSGQPSFDTLRYLRKIAPTILMVGDLSDPPWWPALDEYRRQDCFDLIVSMDGGGPVDHATVTPIDPEPFEGSATRDIVCGFPGNHAPYERWRRVRALHGTEDKRSGLLHRLAPLVELRERAGDYRDYARWLLRCRMVINTSWTGSGLVHHLKGRVIEAALAGCALMEMVASPIGRWFPEGSWFPYGEADPLEMKRIIQHTPPEEAARRARLFADHARTHYHPRQVFAGIMDALRERKAA